MKRVQIHDLVMYLDSFLGLLHLKIWVKIIIKCKNIRSV